MEQNLKELGTLILKKNCFSGPSVDNPEVINNSRIDAGNISVRLHIDPESMKTRGVGLTEIEHYVISGYIHYDNNSIRYTLISNTLNNREW